MRKILIADNDSTFVRRIARLLESDHTIIDTSFDGGEALTKLSCRSYDLIILDWLLPTITGVELCKEYRSRGGQSLVVIMAEQAALDRLARTVVLISIFAKRSQKTNSPTASTG